MASDFDFSFVVNERNPSLSEADVRMEIKQELYRFAEEVMTASKEVVPVDTGALMATGVVMPPEEDATGVTVTLGYGGMAVDYAKIVHENLDPNVHWQRPGSGPKFLENPMKERQDALPDRIATVIRKSVLGL